MAAGLCSSRLLSPSPRVFPPTLEESGDEELSVLPRHTKVIVTGNNRTKSVLIGLQGVVKKAVGLGGWHWLVLKNGVEVKLQRNALSVLEPPTGNEDYNDENELDNSLSLCSSSDREYSSIEFQKPSKSRARHTGPWPPLIKSINHNSHNRAIQAPLCNARTNVNLAKLGTASLGRYWKHFNLVSINPNPSKEQLVNTVHHHFVTQEQLDEMQVILGFIHKAKRLKTLDH